MTNTLTQPLAAEAAGHSRHFQLIVDIHLLLVSNGDLLLGRRAGTGYGDGAYEPPSGRLAEREDARGGRRRGSARPRSG